MKGEIKLKYAQKGQELRLYSAAWPLVVLVVNIGREEER